MKPYLDPPNREKLSTVFTNNTNLSMVYAYTAEVKNVFVFFDRIPLSHIYLVGLLFLINPYRQTIQVSFTEI